jgi:hypothetical protein
MNGHRSDLTKKTLLPVSQHCNARNSQMQQILSFLSLILFPTWIVVNDINFGSTKVIQWVPWRHKVLTHGQERLFRKVTPVSIHSFVEWLDTFSYVLRPADVTVKEVNYYRSGKGTHWMTLVDPKFISLTTIQVGKRIKDKKERICCICELRALHPEGINKKA